MIHYLYLPKSQCKNCKHFDTSGSRTYKCFNDNCPGKAVQIVVRDSVMDCVVEYQKAIKAGDIRTQRRVLNTVEQMGRAFEHKFSLELKSLKES